MFRLAFFSLILTIGTTTAAFAKSAAITEKMIADKYEKLEKALNDRSDAMAMIRTLHEHISDDARFRLTVTNPMAQSGKSPVMEMNKQDYINTYIQGTHYVADYGIDIKTKRFEYNKEDGKAYTFDVMTERGRMMSDLNDGKTFISRTSCRTMHELEGGHPVAKASECHTDISFEEDI